MDSTDMLYRFKTNLLSYYEKSLIYSEFDAIKYGIINDEFRIFRSSICPVAIPVNIANTLKHL